MQYYNDPIEYLLAVIGEKEKYYLNAQSSNPDPRYQSFCKGALQVLKRAKWRVSRTSQNKLDKLHLHYMKQFANSRYTPSGEGKREAYAFLTEALQSAGFGPQGVYR